MVYWLTGAPSSLRTIHGMVYNAMKLFMEINPQLFDDCSHNYTETQSSAEAREAHRQYRWEHMAKLAKLNKQQSNGSSDVQASNAQSISANANRSINVPLKHDDGEMLTRDSQKRLDALRLQDESNGVGNSNSARRAGKDKDGENRDPVGGL